MPVENGATGGRKFPCHMGRPPRTFTCFTRGATGVSRHGNSVPVLTDRAARRTHSYPLCPRVHCRRTQRHHVFRGNPGRSLLVGKSPANSSTHPGSCRSDSVVLQENRETLEAAISGLSVDFRGSPSGSTRQAAERGRPESALKLQMCRCPGVA